MSGKAPESLLVITQWYRPELIGTAFYSGELAEWFARGGRRVSVLTNRPSYPGDSVYPDYRDGARDRETMDGVEVRRMPTRVARGGGALARILAELHFTTYGLMSMLGRDFRSCPTVISFCPSVMAVLVGALARKRGGRHVAVVHDIQSGLAAGLGMVGGGTVLRLMRMAELFCLNRADRVVALSDQMRGALEELGVRRPITVLPIWVDVDAIHPLPRSEGLPPTLLYSGALGRKQGLHQIVDMAAILMTERPDLRIVIRGSGSREEALKAAASERGLSNLSFEPLLPMERFNEGLAAAHIHLVPQNPHAADFAVPSKVYNIMAAGRTFVCTAGEGSTLWKLCRDSGAFLCAPPNDARAFGDAVKALIDDPGRREDMERRGRAYVERHVARDVVLERYEALLS